VAFDLFLQDNLPAGKNLLPLPAVLHKKHFTASMPGNRLDHLIALRQRSLHCFVAAKLRCIRYKLGGGTPFMLPHRFRKLLLKIPYHLIFMISKCNQTAVMMNRNPSFFIPAANLRISRPVQNQVRKLLFGCLLILGNRHIRKINFFSLSCLSKQFNKAFVFLSFVFLIDQICPFHLYEFLSQQPIISVCFGYIP